MEEIIESLNIEKQIRENQLSITECKIELINERERLSIDLLEDRIKCLRKRNTKLRTKLRSLKPCLESV